MNPVRTRNALGDGIDHRLGSIASCDPEVPITSVEQVAHQDSGATADVEQIATRASA